MLHSSPQSLLEASRANSRDKPLPSDFLVGATLPKLESEVEQRDNTSLFLFISVLQPTLEAHPLPLNPPQTLLLRTVIGHSLHPLLAQNTRWDYW